MAPRRALAAVAIVIAAAAGLWLTQRPVEAACTSTLSYGNSVDCDISVAMEVDTFTFSGTDGDRVLIRLHEVDDVLDGHFTLKDPSSGTVCSGQTVTSESTGECTLEDTGTFTIEVWSDDSDTGDYLLYIRQTNATPEPAVTEIDYGDVTSATLGQMEWKPFEFEGVAGERLIVSAIATSGDVAPWMDLRTAGGDAGCGASSAGSFWQDCTLGSTGTHHLWIYSWTGDQSGTFDLYVARRSDPPTEPVSWQRYGDTVSRTLDPGHANPHRFYGEAGDVVEVDLNVTSGDLIWTLYVYGSSWNLACIASGYNHVDPDCTLPSDDVYTAWARASSPSSTATYDTTITLVGLAAPTPGDTGHPVADPRYPALAPPTGFTYEHTDIAVAGYGVPLGFTRYYRSGSTVDRSMGVGWTHSYDIYVEPGTYAAEVHFPQGHSATFPITSAGDYETRYWTEVLVENIDGSFTLATKGAVEYEFDSSGVLTTIRDRNGNETDVVYDVNGDLDYVEDASGRQLDFTVDGNGRITAIELPLTRTVEYAYNGSGELETFTDLLGGETDYAYGSYGLTTITDPRDNVALTNGYDTAGRLREQQDALGKSTCTYYGYGVSYSSGNCTGVSPAPAADEAIVVDAEGHATIVEWEQRWRVSSITDALGGVTANVYSEANYVTQVVDPLGRVRSFTYDERGNVLTRTDPLNLTWTYTYNSYNDVLTATDPRSNTTTYTYDGSGNLATITDAESGVAEFTVNGLGLVTTVTDARDNETDYTYDTYGNRETVTNQLDDVWTYTYDAGSRLTTVEDPLGHETGYTHNDADQVLTVTNELSETTTNVYDANGNLTSVTDAETNATTYTYDAANRLTKVTDDLSQETKYGYDDVGNQTSVTNVRGKTTTYTYDELYRRTTITDPLSRVTEYEYDAIGNPLQRIDARGLYTTYEYDDGNRLTKVNYTEPPADFASQVSAIGDDLILYWRLGESSGTSAEDETANDRDGTIGDDVTLGASGAIEFDGDDAMTFDGSADSYVSIASGNGMPTGSSGRSFGIWIRTDETTPNTDGIFGYGNNGVGSQSWNLRRDSGGNDRLRFYMWGYDFTFNLPSGSDIADGEWHFVTITYNGGNGTYIRLYYDGVEATNAMYVGSLPNTVDDTLYVGRTTNDERWRGDLDEFFAVDRRLTENEVIGLAERSERITITTSADDVWQNGDSISTTDENIEVGYRGSTADHHYMRFPDVAIPQGSEILGATVFYVARGGSGTSVRVDVAAYDVDDAPQVSNDTEFDDAIAAATTAIDESGSIYGFNVDSGDPFALSATDAVQEVIGRPGWESGNALGILVLNDSSNSAGEYLWLNSYDSNDGGSVGDWAPELVISYAGSYVEYEYDAAGNRTEMTDSTGVTSYTYDDLNRLTSVTFPDSDVVSYTYDANGNRTQIVYPDTKDVDYTYDAANQLIEVEDWLANETDYAYDDAGRLTSTTLPNGVVATYAYDDANRLLSVTNKLGMTTISSFTYTLDSVGNRTQVVDNQGTTTFDYDDLYRLTSVTYPGPVTDTYTYDALGNRLTRNSDDYTYDDADQLTDVEGTSYDYDDNGNLIERGSDTFAWDRENRMRTATVSSVTSAFVYNGDGVRVRQVADGTPIEYEVDVAAPLPLVVQDGTYSYVYGLDLIAAIDGSSNEIYYLYDGLGSVAELTDDSGVKTDSYVYDAFGAVTSSTGSTANDWLFTGEQEDGDTGLYFLRARYYDPETGRFMARDPLEFNQRYAYAGNNPVAYTDPAGLEAEGSRCYYHYDYEYPANFLASGTQCNTYSSDSSGLHSALDACGFAPLVGEPCDAINGVVYGLEGEVVDASISLGAVFGLDFLKGFRFVRRVPAPSRVQDVLAHVDDFGSAPPGYIGGRRFANDGRAGGQQLPTFAPNGNPVTYREFDVNPWRSGVNRGGERLVIGSDGSAYYTSDHYGTFTQIRPGQ